MRRKLLHPFKIIFLYICELFYRTCAYPERGMGPQVAIGFLRNNNVRLPSPPPPEAIGGFFSSEVPDGIIWIRA